MRRLHEIGRACKFKHSGVLLRELEQELETDWASRNLDFHSSIKEPSQVLLSLTLSIAHSLSFSHAEMLPG